jgi:hypothetical protein
MTSRPIEVMAGETTSALERFIERWQSVSGSERANYQLFVHELCSLLELPTPDPAHEDIFHDLIGNDFNVDHVLVGPAGIFTVETKTFSKPARGNAKVTFDGENVLVNGFRPDRDPVTQARAQANWLRNLVLESTGRKVVVRSVVLFRFVSRNRERVSARVICQVHDRARFRSYQTFESRRLFS